MPDNVRRLRGMPELGTRRVTLAPVAPQPPSWLDREAMAEWRRILPALEALGLLAKVDRAVVANYCTAWSHAVAARALLEESGLVVNGKRDGPAKSPAWQIYREAVTLCTTLGKELYLTPAARLRSTMPAPPDDDSSGWKSGILD